MPLLHQKPTLHDIQKYVSELEKERGFSHENILQKSLLLGEEVGELFKAIRKQQKMGIDYQSKIGTVADELADILILTCAIANRLDINLEEAFRSKEEINAKRIWKAG